VFGLAMLLGLLGVCTNVALGLWSRSTTESIAYEAAWMVATAPADADPHRVRATARDRACEMLGSRCDEVSLTFDDPIAAPGRDLVEVRVVAPGVPLLPRMVAAGGPIVAPLDRTIRIRRER